MSEGSIASIIQSFLDEIYLLYGEKDSEVTEIILSPEFYDRLMPTQARGCIYRHRRSAVQITRGSKLEKGELSE